MGLTESESFAVRSESLIAVPQRELDDLKRRIASMRWPHSWPTEPWAAGTDVEEMRRLADYWADGYDWPAHEEQINALPSYTAEVKGQRIHKAVLGIHVMSVGMPREWDDASLTEEERAHVARMEGWNRDEGAYIHQHRTRPLSLAFGLSDSPVGLLAWVSEKYRAWSERNSGQVLPFLDDFVLTQASLYWFTNTIGTSLRPDVDDEPAPVRRIPHRRGRGGTDLRYVRRDSVLTCVDLRDVHRREVPPVDASLTA